MTAGGRTHLEEEVVAAVQAVEGAADDDGRVTITGRRRRRACSRRVGFAGGMPLAVARTRDGDLAGRSGRVRDGDGGDSFLSSFGRFLLHGNHGDARAAAWNGREVGEGVGVGSLVRRRGSSVFL